MACVAGGLVGTIMNPDKVVGNTQRRGWMMDGRKRSHVIIG